MSEKELLAQVQCLWLHCVGTKSVAYRTQKFIPSEKFVPAMMPDPLWQCYTWITYSNTFATKPL